MDSTGAVFINRDGDLFAHALQFMRDGKRTALPQNTDVLQQLVRESEYFGMDIWRTELHHQLTEMEKQRNQGDVIPDPYGFSLTSIICAKQQLMSQVVSVTAISINYKKPGTS
ncbi:unnamed protein product [Heligmosomoides polygyrus]|uniref:BTB_2 domain-containing protein n=1 Tax=Heligmosomoides polygyrus TaxID=6339 RepID=A0A183GKM6_HELPZ|nr:unnamed protein product [Heligmosomoides polygyrus]